MQLVYLPYNRRQVNANLLLFFGEKDTFFVWQPKKGKVIILKYEEGRCQEKEQGKHPAKSARSDH